MDLSKIHFAILVVWALLVIPSFVFADNSSTTQSAVFTSTYQGSQDSSVWSDLHDAGNVIKQLSEIHKNNGKGDATG